MWNESDDDDDKDDEYDGRMTGAVRWSQTRQELMVMDRYRHSKPIHHRHSTSTQRIKHIPYCRIPFRRIIEYPNIMQIIPAANDYTSNILFLFLNI